MAPLAGISVHVANYLATFMPALSRASTSFFLRAFSKKDVADDEQLRILVEEVRGLLNGQDISRIRKDQGLRELVQERMQSVKVVLDTLVEDAPARQIVLRD